MSHVQVKRTRFEPPDDDGDSYGGSDMDAPTIAFVEETARGYHMDDG